MLNEDDSHLSVDGLDTNQNRENTPNVMPNGLDFILFFGIDVLFYFKQGNNITVCFANISL